MTSTGPVSQSKRSEVDKVITHTLLPKLSSQKLSPPLAANESITEQPNLIGGGGGHTSRLAGAGRLKGLIGADQIIWWGGYLCHVRTRDRG